MNAIVSFTKDPTRLLLAALVALSLMGAWSYAEETPGLDYYVAWVAADSVENKSSNYIYNQQSRRNLLVLYKNKAQENQEATRQNQIAAYRTQIPMTATPFLYWVTAQLSTGDYERDLSLWHLISIAFLTLSILVSCRILGYSPVTSMILLTTILVWFAPFQSDMRVGNVNSFQLGLVGLALWLQSRGIEKWQTFFTGLVIGLLVMFKPNLGPVAILLASSWLIRRQYRRLGYSLAGMVSGGIFAIIVSSWWLSSSTAWLDWLKILKKVVTHGPGKSGGNYAIVSEVAQGISAPNQFILALVLCAVCLLAFWWGSRRKATTGPVPEDVKRITLENNILIAMGCLVAMLASTLVWIHYYVLIIPMLIVLLRPWGENRKITLIPILLTRVLPVLLFIPLLDSAFPYITGIEPKNYWTTVTMSSTSLLFAIGLWQFGYGVRDQSHPEEV